MSVLVIDRVEQEAQRIGRERAWRQRDIRDIEGLLRTKLTGTHERALREALVVHQQALKELKW